MISMPEHRAILGVDVIKSARIPGYLLNELPPILNSLVDGGLTGCGVDGSLAIDRQHTGDGLRLTWPATVLGAVVDATSRIDELVRAHNRVRKPEVRLRMAVHAGHVPDEVGYHRPNIDCARLLDAAVFRDLLATCARERPDDAFNTGVILSDAAWRAVFAGPYTELVHQHDFVEVVAIGKEFSATAWVRVPGIGREQLAAYVRGLPVDQVAGARTIAGTPTLNVTNNAGSNSSGVQAGIIRGDITIGRDR